MGGNTGTELDFESTTSFNKSDKEIVQEIQNALAWHIPFPAILAASVENGRVTLRGETAWEYERQNIEKVVRGLRGVVDVTNRIAVCLETHQTPRKANPLASCSTVRK